MRAVLCTEFGPPEKLVMRDIPVPKPSKQQVRIKIEACGVNFPDTLIIENKYQYKPDLPFSPGGEVAGIIDELGDEVTNYSVGEKVMAMTLFGGFSEYICSQCQCSFKNSKRNGFSNRCRFYNDLWYLYVWA